MAKSIIDYDVIISQPKAKLNYIIKNYLASNYSQVFISGNPLSLKKTLGRHGDDMDNLAEELKVDLTNMLDIYFDYVEIDVEILEEDNKYIMTMGLLCDGASYKESLTIKEMVLISDNPYVETYRSIK